MLTIDAKPRAVSETVAGLKALGVAWREAGVKIAEDESLAIGARTEANIAAGSRHGSLASTIRSRVEMDDASERIVGRVFSESPVFVYVEEGRKAHRRPPSIDSLAPFVLELFRGTERQLRSIAFVLARSIARKGIKGRRFLERAFTSVKTVVPSIISRRIDEALAKGRR